MKGFSRLYNLYRICLLYSYNTAIAMLHTSSLPIPEFDINNHPEN
ncbi:hypothetical protein [Dolichospermum circinale]|nr:hypothetical protein [Dolichospermum circinale]MDB9461177.1 hypothetical protein [Dolichospermum circinale CS-541/04]